MSFSSIIFLFYFLPTLLVLYYTIGTFSIYIRNLLLLAASLLFCAWGDPNTVLVLIAACILNWALGLLIGRLEKGKKILLLLGCLINVGILFLFRYSNFAVEIINFFSRALDTGIVFNELNLWAPIGVLIFTLQGISYLVDVFRGTVSANKNPINVALYVSFFPQLIAGPIVKYHFVEEQLKCRKHSSGDMAEGVCRFAEGLCKKVLLAGTFAGISDHIFQMTMAGHLQMQIPVLLAWIGAAALMFQIYFDFSGYADMALGLCKMFGFTIKENFNYPYMARSIREFGSRFNISLWEWAHEYLYLPIGGLKEENADAKIRNYFVLWIFIGLWYGASWMFIYWGMIQFLFVVMEELTKFEENRRVPVAVKHAYALILICLGWVMVRSENFYQLKEYFGNLFGRNQNGFYNDSVIMFLREYFIFWLAGILLCFPWGRWIRNNFVKHGKWLAFVEKFLYPAVMILLVIVSVGYIVKGGSSTYLHFWL